MSFLHKRGRILLLFLALLITGTARGQAPADPLEVRVEEIEKIGIKGLAILPYRPTYILPTSHLTHSNEELFARQTNGAHQQDVEVKYQISFRFPVWRNVFGSPAHLYAAYTQLSFWQAYNGGASSPFRDSTYEPEAMLVFPLRFPAGPLMHRAVVVGIVHQSNGQGADRGLSRSWNRLYARFVVTGGPLILSLRGWWRIPETDDDNPDISKYMGYGDVVLTYHWGTHSFSALWRNNLRVPHNRGAIEWGWSHPLVYGLRWYVQYWNGYGESLVTYDSPSERIGAGILLGEWL